ncbi:2-(1,2-epoxy-1,2-dihydrophenyl)acetyl-CoA isomerase [Microbacterium sp. ru370.1]|uniref:enoyl-CoA hydratase/isomerase family protein n=1 Tax=unclassified Microbacterium TaxID=2609290 RepID=UPI00088A60D3|nr:MULTISPECIES: enoyl-CoA hydratase-related protein [unclassified Microbacterium]SDO28892.1 2-(1,2-epoxy-1,2-dihydrophenyl)acetyl-CoA isomerase [Microbacterium sp. ru370.1]SIT75371.1 2-(1,2-epoxy-1,2-dihydrophenyl)acetyl-CoA isomerase [Microbacterium sp. RU1D]
MTDGILLHVEGGLARVTFDRPASLNAMDFPMARRWRDVAHEVTSDSSVGAVILDANGPAFCAGGDVVAMSTSGSTGAEVTETARAIHDGIRTFAEAPLPMVAAVQGAVAGGGLGLMLTADYVVASENARFVSRYADIGLTPDLGVSTLLPAAIGQRRALQLLLQDRMLSAAEARDWGLVAEVVASAELSARVDEIARFWLDGATAAFGQATRLVRVGAGRAFAENLDDEAATIGAAFDTPEARARVQAFAAASAKGPRS